MRKFQDRQKLGKFGQTDNMCSNLEHGQMNYGLKFAKLQKTLGSHAFCAKQL